MPAGSTIADILDANKVYDTTFKFNALAGKDFSIYKVTDGVETRVPASDYEVTNTNDAKKIQSTIKFNKEIEGKYVVKYNVGFSPKASQIMTVADNVNFKNTATLKVPVDGQLQNFGSTTNFVDFTKKIANTYKSLRDINYETKTNKYVILVTVPEDGHQYSVKDMIPTDGSLYDFKLESIESTKDKKYADSSIVTQDGSTINFDLFKGNATTPSGTYTITYTMKFDADKSKSKNIPNNYILYKDKVQNTTELRANHNLTINKLAVNNGFKSGTIRYNSEGNYEGKDYQVGINYNLHDLTGAIVTDTLKGSQTYVKDSFKLYKWTIAKEANNTANITEITDVNWEEALVFSDEMHKFTIDLDKLLPEGASKTAAYQISYQSKFDDQITSSDLGNGIQTTYSKTVAENMVENGKVVTDTSVVPYAGNYVTKSSAQEGRLAHWNVEINGTQSKLSDVKIKDDLSTGHSIVDTSFKLYKAQVKDGKLQKVGEPLEVNKDYTVDVKNNSFTLALANATFKIVGPNDQVYTEVSNAKGEITLANVPIGTYTIEETKAPEGYELNSKVFTVEITTNSTMTQVVTNQKETPKTGELKLHKVDGETNEPLAGAEFTIKGKDFEQVVTSDENGLIDVTELPIGTYTIEETKAPEGYYLAKQSFQAVITPAGIYEQTVLNTKKPVVVEAPKVGSLLIHKTDAETEKSLAGAEFTITGPNGYSIVKETNNKGYIELTDLPIGDYKMKETKAPEGYDLNDTEETVTINDQTTFTLTVQNAKTVPQVGSLVIHKVSDTEESLAGAEFTITGPNGYEETKVTNNAGYIELNELPAGEYVVKETKAPAGYVLTDAAYTVNVMVQGTFTQTVVNAKELPKVGQLTLKKVDATTEVALKDATFTVVGPNDFKQEVTTNANGISTLKDLVPGTYTIQETKAPNGYVLETTAYDVDVIASETVSQTITNEKQQANVTLKKVDAITNEALKGAVFNLFAKDGTLVKQNLVTDQNGEIVVEKLVNGHYQFVEVKAPNGYTLDDAPLSFTMEGNDVSVEFGNTKVSETTPDKPKDEDTTPITPDQPKDDGTTTVTPDKPTSNETTTGTGTNKPSESASTTPNTEQSTVTTQPDNQTTNKGGVLPQTGDKMTLFSWIGGIILLLAIVFFVMARRKRQ